MASPVSTEPLRVVVHPDVRAFLARAQSWLERAPMQHAMVLSSAQFASHDDRPFEKPLYWATIENDAAIVGCAFRTPPFRLGLTALPHDAIAPLVASVAAVYRDLSGVAGPEPAASAFAAAWARLRGGRSTVRSRQSLLAHKAIVPSRAPPPGTLRPATADDAALAHRWGTAFARDSGIAGLDGALCVQLIAHGYLHLWIGAAGTPCAMLGVLRETKDAAALGILYTPPELRERGFACAAVAAFSRRLLERGMRESYFCLEPSNAAGYAICLKLGYDVVQETADIDFIATPAAASTSTSAPRTGANTPQMRRDGR